MSFLRRFFCKHHTMIRKRDYRGYGGTCKDCGYYRVIFRTTQPIPKEPPTLPAVKCSEPGSADRWSRYQ